MGAACAKVLAPAVDVLVLTDVHAERLERAAEVIEREMTTKVCIEVVDLSDAAAIDDLAARAGELGTFRALVHSAGLSPSMAGWREILQVDLVATARLLDGFSRARQPGSVAVCVASVSAHMGDFDPRMDAVLDEARTPPTSKRASSDSSEPNPTRGPLTGWRSEVSCGSANTLPWPGASGADACCRCRPA